MQKPMRREWPNRTTKHSDALKDILSATAKLPDSAVQQYSSLDCIGNCVPHVGLRKNAKVVTKLNNPVPRLFFISPLAIISGLGIAAILGRGKKFPFLSRACLIPSRLYEMKASFWRDPGDTEIDSE